MATCNDKKEKWQDRVVLLEDPDVALPVLLAVPDILYSCEGAIQYNPLNPLGYFIPESGRGTQKSTGLEAPGTRSYVYLEITGVTSTTLELFGRRNVFVYELEADARIGPLGIYNVGSNARFTLFPADGESGNIEVQVVIEDGPNTTPADVDEPPDAVAI